MHQDSPCLSNNFLKHSISSPLTWFLTVLEKHSSVSSVSISLSHFSISRPTAPSAAHVSHLWNPKYICKSLTLHSWRCVRIWHRVYLPTMFFYIFQHSYSATSPCGIYSVWFWSLVGYLFPTGNRFVESFTDNAYWKHLLIPKVSPLNSIRF